MKVLAIDTSNEILGLSLINHDKVIGEYSTNVNKNHSIRLMPAIEHLLKDCQTTPDELTKIVVAEGPGSYTGVRIGVTVAKLMAWSLSIPLIGVSSLAALAANAHHFSGYICPLFDARRGLVYTGLYRYGADHVLQQVQTDTNTLVDDWLDELVELREPILFIGNDVSIHREIITKKLGGYACFSTIAHNNPRASELAVLGNQYAERDIHSFTPNYIRLVEAEAKWLEKQVKDHD